MTDRHDRREWLANLSKRPMGSVVFLPAADAGIVESIESGILFLMAFWSGSAVTAFAALSEVLATPQTEGLTLLVADVDGSPALCTIPEFSGRVHGHGETAWIHQGKIIATSGLGLNIDCFAPNTSTLHSRSTAVVWHRTRSPQVSAGFLPAGKLRHHDHRFEWTRGEFQEWAERVAARHGYGVRFVPVGPVDEKVGSPTQMCVFTQQEGRDGTLA